jgi:hypothetical protein
MYFIARAWTTLGKSNDLQSKDMVDIQDFIRDNDHHIHLHVHLHFLDKRRNLFDRVCIYSKCERCRSFFRQDLPKQVFESEKMYQSVREIVPWWYKMLPLIIQSRSGFSETQTSFPLELLGKIATFVV